MGIGGQAAQLLQVLGGIHIVTGQGSGYGLPGSTGGGMKVSRIVIAFKTFLRQMGQSLHPRAVRRVRFEDREVEEDTVRAVSLYFAAVAFIFVASLLLVSLEGQDVVTSFTAVAATFNNIGPGLNAVGPACNYGALTDLTKWVLIFDMLTGRLEIFPMLMLFYSPLWRETASRIRRERRRAAGVSHTDC